MKITLLLFSLIITELSIAQSQYSIDPGIDSIADHHNIKQKLAYTLRLRDSVMDTVSLTIHSFDELGQIIQYEEYDYINKYFRTANHPKIKVLFSYNEEGYLISERIPYSGPILITSPAYPIDTIHHEMTEKSETIGSVTLLVERLTRKTGKNGKLIFQERIQFHYSTKHQLEKEEHFYSYEDEPMFKTIFSYRYSDKGLPTSLLKENAEGPFYKESYSFTFYD